MKTQHGKDGNSVTTIEQEKELVVLVHGIWMTGLEMSLLARRLRQNGYSTKRFSYRSLRLTPAENADQLYQFIKQQQAEKVHLVAHSLGGIVLMHLFDRHANIPPGRLVLMGSPVQGSGVARRMDSLPVLRSLLGLSRVNGLLGNAPVWNGGRDLGVIAGSEGFGIGTLIGGLSGPGDGAVTIAETEVVGADDFCLIPAGHMGMVISQAVADEVFTFLQTGKFSGRHAI